MRILPIAVFLILLVVSTTCTRLSSGPTERFKVSLNVGVRGLVELDDSESEVLNKAKKFRHRTVSLSSVNAPAGVVFSQILHFQDLGVKAYFSKDRVSLIEIQEPFKGEIIGKRIQLFTFKTPPAETWRDRLIQEFGPPQAEATGGRLRSTSLFYSWGDIAFNRMGPNEIAIHRDQNMTRYRETNFGRSISFFNK